MKSDSSKAVSAALMMVLAGCATQGKPPPVISLDEPSATQAHQFPEPPKPLEVVPVPEPLPLPAQMKPLVESAPVESEPVDERLRVSRANQDARVAPTREGYVNAIQVWPYSEGALYQVYTSPGRVTAITLQEGEELSATRPADRAPRCA
jgi:hypothetical protein